MQRWRCLNDMPESQKSPDASKLVATEERVVAWRGVMKISSWSCLEIIYIPLVTWSPGPSHASYNRSEEKYEAAARERYGVAGGQSGDTTDQVRLWIWTWTWWCWD